jgi:hypothetical protein
MPGTTGAGAVAGTKIYIGGSDVVPSPDDYVEIGQVSSLGDVGLTFSKIAIESVGSGYTFQIKGTQSAPACSMVLNRDDSDAGQALVRLASVDRNTKFNFKVVENDIGTGTTATTQTFKGRVYGYGTKYGGVNAVKQVAFDIEIEPDTIVVTAAT